MKYRCYLAPILIGVACCSMARAELHEFKLPDGRSIKAEIVDFNAKLGVAELKLENGSVKKIKPSIFVKDDQDYISGWAQLAGFRSPSFFKITCQTDLVEKWKETETGDISYSDGSTEEATISETKYERFVYEIKLENRNAVPLKNIKIEYRIFYEQGLGGSGDERSKLTVSKKKVSGDLDLASLAPKKKLILKTKPVVIHEKEYSGDFDYTGGDPVKESGDIKGIWLQVSTKGADGKKVIRNVYEPASIHGKYTW